MKRMIYFMLFLLLLTACKAKLQSEWQPDELLKIDGKSVKTMEAAVYGIQVKKEFEQIGGKDIWEFEAFSGGKSAYEVAKTKVLENLIRIKILAAKAKERKIELLPEEIKSIETRVDEFLAEKRELESATVKIDQQDVKAVFTEFELGQKLKREMLRSFQPSVDMVIAKLLDDESYQALEQENPKDKYEYFLVKISRMEMNEENKKQIEEIQRQLNEKGVLTDAFSQSMVYQEEKYKKLELDTLFGSGFADSLRKKDEQLVLSKDGEAYIYIKLIGLQLSAPDKLHLELKKQEQKKQKLREQAEEAVRDDSFNVIYSEWKKEANIQINQEIWQEFIVFSLSSEKN